MKRGGEGIAMRRGKRVLIVDDESMVHSVLGMFFDKKGVEHQSAMSGEEALEMLSKHHFDLVLTDVMMPGMDGLALIRKLREANSNIPVAIITGFGALDLAVEAIRNGAVDFIKKPFDFAHIGQLLNKVFARQDREIGYQMVLGLIRNASFVLPNDSSVLESAARIAAKCFEGTPAYDGVCLALTEALTNAMEHGNLRISQSMKLDAMGDESFYELVHERLCDPELGKRRVYLEMENTGTSVKYVVRDEGEGFDWRDLPDPTHPENLFKASGRGILLIRCYMDKVYWNETGNQITMEKRLAAGKD